MRFSAGFCLLALAASLSGCGAPHAPSALTSSVASVGEILPVPVTALQGSMRRLELLPAASDKHEADLLKEEVLSNFDALTKLDTAADRAAALAEVRKAQFLAQKRSVAMTSKSATDSLMQLWNDSVEMELILRRIYGESIMKDLWQAVGTTDSESVVAIANELANLGSGDFAGRLIDCLTDTTDAAARSALLRALAKSTRAGMASAWLYENFLATPNLELLSALVETGLPTQEALNALAKRRWGDAEWTGEKAGGLKASALDAIQFVFHTNPAGRRHEEEKKAREVEAIRKATAIAVEALAATIPEAHELARPLVGPFLAQRDSEGYYVNARGMTLREGDLLLFRFAPWGFSWEAFSDSPARFSHVGIVTFSPEGKPMIADQGYTQIDFSDLETAFRRGIYSTLVRDNTLTPADRQKLRLALWDMGSRPQGFDYRFDMSESNKTYCAELVWELYKRAGLPHDFPLYSFQNARANAFMKQMGVKDGTFIAPGSFVTDKRFGYLGHVYEGSSARLVAGRVAVDTLLSVFSRSTWADFSKAEGQAPTATVVDLYRIFRVGGLEVMSQALARNVRSLDGSLSEVTKRIENRLEQMDLDLRDIEQYRKAAERVAREEIGTIYQKAFRF